MQIWRFGSINIGTDKSWPKSCSSCICTVGYKIGLKSILKSRVWFQTSLHSTQFNYHYELYSTRSNLLIKWWRKKLFHASFGKNSNWMSSNLQTWEIFKVLKKHKIFFLIYELSILLPFTDHGWQITPSIMGFRVKRFRAKRCPGKFVRLVIYQFWYIKIQPKKTDLCTKLCGINTKFVMFVP